MGVMGAGLAQQIRTKWPVVYTEYKEHVTLTNKVLKSWSLLGSYQVVSISDKLHVLNAFSQYGYGAGERQSEYCAIERIFTNLYDDLTIKYNHTNIVTDIYIPYGVFCGYGGAKWEIVEEMLQYYFKELDYINIHICRL